MTVVVIFVLLRFIDGIFLGGEYTSASPLAMEYCPREKRGLYGAVIMTGYPLAYATISLITMFLRFILPAGDLGSPTCSGAGGYRSSSGRLSRSLS